MKKTFLFVNVCDTSKPSAVLNRFLAIARGLCEGGDSVYWILLASKLTSVIAEDSSYSTIKFITIGRSKALLLKNKHFIYIYRCLLYTKLARVVDKISQDNAPTIWFEYGSRIPFLWLACKLCDQYGTILIHEKGEYPHLGRSLRSKINQSFYMNYFIPRCKYIFVNTTALKFYFEKHLQLMGKSIPVHILNISVEPDKYSESSRHIVHGPRSIVYIGTIYGTKDGVYDLVKAFSMIMEKYTDTKLVIIGDTSRRDRMQEVLRELDNLLDPRRVELTGQLNRDEVVKRINGAYCLALSRPDNIQAKHGFPTKLGEYLSTGRPVVITGVGDIPLFLKDGHNAFVATPGDIVDFAAKMSTCLKNQEEAEVIGQRGKELVSTVFNYLAVASVLSRSLDKS